MSKVIYFGKTIRLLGQLVERCIGIAEAMGSNPVWALIFFQVLFSTTRFSSVLSCEDLLISFLHRSANMWIFICLKSSWYDCVTSVDGLKVKLWMKRWQLDFTYYRIQGKITFKLILSWTFMKTYNKLTCHAQSIKWFEKRKHRSI